MSPTKRPSEVGLRKGLGTAAPLPAAPVSVSSPQVEKYTVRVTLNIPSELYRHLTTWRMGAADALGRPRVSQQDAIRAMIRMVVLPSSPGQVGAHFEAMLTELRRDSED